MIAPDLDPAARGSLGEVRFGERMRSPDVPDPLVMVIFGATGDLTRRKLMPALFRLFSEGLLPREFAVLGVARESWSDDEFRARMREAVEGAGGAAPEGGWSEFEERLGYVATVFEQPECFTPVAERLRMLDRERGTRGNRLFYLAIPPGAIGTVAERLQTASLVREATAEPWSRVIVEKPFGRDLQSSRELNRLLLSIFDERQIYRIDHYLGKETVQNLLVFRFANVIWEPVWNRNYIDHVQITVGEDVGVERRAGYYERAGALRDMVQSHLFQLLMLFAMEPPTSYDPESIRSEKVKVLRAVRPLVGKDVERNSVRGQYSAGVVGGRPAAGYREEPDVSPQSTTETFAALRLFLENWRWAGVPFYLRTGKRLPRKLSEIAVQFRPAPHPILDTVQGDCPAPNRLVLRIQPEEGISLFFEAKVPGLRGPLRPVSMDFDYQTSFTGLSPEAYQRLLLDAMQGDPTLFARCDEVDAAWSLVDPILSAWERGEPEPYPAGSWGPTGAQSLLAERGHQWLENA